MINDGFDKVGEDFDEEEELDRQREMDEELRDMEDDEVYNNKLGRRFDDI